MQTVLRIDPRNRTATRADFDDVDDRRLDREAFHVAIGVINGIDRKAAVLDQRALCRGAAHIESDDVFEAKFFGVGAGADAATDGAGFDQTDGLPASSVGG